MSLLIRKIDKGKWLQNDIVNGADISADAITNCMKTTKNTLSTWRVDNEEQLEIAVLAIVSGHQQIDTIDVVWVDQIQMEQEGIAFERTPGITPITSLVDSHVDVVNLTYASLGKFAYCIVNCFLEKKIKRYTRGMLKNMLREAINSGKINEESLAPSIVAKL